MSKELELMAIEASELTLSPTGALLSRGIPVPLQTSDTYVRIAAKYSATGPTKQFLLHRIVARLTPHLAAEMLKRDIAGETYHVDHVDENKRNNRPSNLQVLSPKENAAKANKLVARNKTFTFKGDYTAITTLYNEGYTQVEIANMLNCSQAAISKALKDGVQYRQNLKNRNEFIRATMSEGKKSARELAKEVGLDVTGIYRILRTFNQTA